ncbi:raffinose/stachyose/melibiose transport system permease protein [Paenibacillus sp. V4I3]|uniref:carbohydrate ABC transporter permease n=1 Tax=unclassified Paenibacillus TaxID=185978 RepID=UPI00277E9172|nr:MULTISPECIES: carbohydrate ABC transporter permease [unclassified Paenibacillus]MDQ0872416.1 raffinose/stachyose/melibiose transport system permease protein [Paenibacillus sp. V4I3]MDQ0891697.1 raffinose/stachyose/melibiose transport system permease protein [Paenibacillus sp. V4I9]
MPRISGRIITWIFLLAVAALLLLPIVLAMLGSFKTNQELNAGTSILPSIWQFENYMYTWKEAKFSRYVWNSLIYSISATITTIIVCALASYAVARKDFPGKKLLLGVYSAMMFIHMGVITLKPAYQIMVMLGLHKSIFGLIIMMTGAGGTTFFILYAFIKGISKDLDEAAMIDGAGSFYIFSRIILPLCTPAIGVVALFAFRGAWNNYIMPLVFTMSQPNLQPITVGLANIRYGYGGAVQSHLMLTGACISMVPMLLIYLLANKSFVQMNVGALKG